MTTDTPTKSKPNILRIIIYFLAGVIIMTTAATNLLVVYVMFAPDNLPKPIYLVYQLPVGSQPTVEGGVPAGSDVGVNSGGANPLAIFTGKPTAATTPQNGSASPTGKTTPEVTSDVTPGQGIMVDTSTKIVNLAEPGGKKFIRVTATLEFAPPAGYASLTAEQKTAALAAFMADISTKIPILDDTIITSLASKDFQSVYTTAGKDTLRQEILDAVNTRLPEYKVIYVYFKEFVMQ
ncbi:MAG TPA: flagellar basal body-associated FliL family protein [Leptolinea sp.]